MEQISEFGIADPLAHFHDDSGRTGTDASRLAAPEASPNEAAIFSVLQLRAVMPPLSPWTGVQRFLPGYKYSGMTRLDPVRHERSESLAALSEEQQLHEVDRLLDEILLEIIGDGPDPVVLFSGGIDSGIIANRLMLLGRRDTLLLNYSFGPDDAESQHAEAMAKCFGLKFERISGSPAPFGCLEQPGRVYQQPFADISAGATAELALAAIKRLAGEKRPILSGVAADGIFGLASVVRSWKRVRQVPLTVRRGASSLYAAGLWSKNNKLEYFCRLARRSAIMPPVLDTLASNPLAGILYEDHCKDHVHALYDEWMTGVAGESLSRRTIFTDIALWCAGMAASKEHSIFANAGLQVHYPFMHTKMFPYAFAASEDWNMFEPKRVLKQSLVRYVPNGMVYRTKSGFTDPRNQMFFEPQFIAYLRAAAESSGPIASLLRQRELRKACDLLARGHHLPIQTLFCLWAIVFTDRWYRTAVKPSGSAL